VDLRLRGDDDSYVAKLQLDVLCTLSDGGFPPNFRHRLAIFTMNGYKCGHGLAPAAPFTG
jgi:hypothetical protein